MADPETEAQRILDELGLGDGSSAVSAADEADRILAELGIGSPREEGWDPFQPIRTFFGASQGALTTPLLGGTDVYKKAQEELQTGFGVKPEDPWYEQAETLPGAGDIAAQLVPQSIRESAVGRAVGPALRIVGNIAGDPTTYTPFIAAKGAGAIARGVAGVPELMQAGKGLAGAEKLANAERIAQLVLERGTPGQVRAYQGLLTGERAGNLGMGVGAAAAYGPEAVSAAYEGLTERLPAAEGLEENVVEGANAILMTGLSLLMGKGVIDAGVATRTAAQHMAEQRGRAGAVGAADEAVAQRAASLPLQGEEGGIPPLPPEVPPGPVEAAPTIPREATPAFELDDLADSGVTQPVRVLGETAPIEASGETQAFPAFGDTEPFLPPEALPVEPTPPPEAPPAPAGAEAAVPVDPLEALLQASIDQIKRRRAGLPEPAPEPKAATPVEAAPPEPVIPRPIMASDLLPARAEPTPSVEVPRAEAPPVEALPAAPVDVAPAPIGKKSRKAALTEALDSVDDPLKAAPEMRELIAKATKDNEGIITEALLDPKKRAALVADIKGKSPREILTLMRRRAQAKKVLDADVATEKKDAYQRTVELLSTEKVKVKNFVEGLPEFEFPGPGRTVGGERPLYKFSGNIREAYMKYLEQREAGKTRADAIKIAAKIKPQFQNYVGGIEKEAERVGIGRFGAEEDAAALAADRPAVATPEQMKRLKSELDSRFPALKLPEESVEGFTQRMQNPEVLTLLADYNRYLEVRKNVPGAQRAGDARVLQLAKDLGIVPNKKPAIQREILPAILNKLGVDPDIRKELQQQAETQVAAKIRRDQAKPFEPGSTFKAVAGKKGVYRSTNGSEIHVAGDKDYTATLADFTDEAGLVKDLEALARDEKLGRIAVPDFPRSLDPDKKVLPGRGPKAARALEAAGFIVEPDKSPDAIPTYVKPKRVAGMGARMNTEELKAALRQRKDIPAYRNLVELIEEAEKRNRFPDPKPTPDPNFWDSFRSTPRNLPVPWDLLGVPEVVGLTNLPPYLLIKDSAIKGMTNVTFGRTLRDRLAAKGIKGFGAQQPAYRTVANGSYHSVYQLNGTTDAFGNEVVMRVGFAPKFPYTARQDALLMPTLDYGVLPTENGPLHYTIHRKGMSPRLWVSATVDPSGKLGTAMQRVGFAKVAQGFDVARELDAEMSTTHRLPDGVTFSDLREDMTQLYNRLAEERMASVDGDSTTTTLRTPESMARGDQLLYVPVEGKEAPDGAVIRVGANGRRWQLVVSDYGAFVPTEKVGPWPHMSRQVKVGLQMRTADKDLSVADQRSRHADYAQAGREGVKIDAKGKLVAANHDNLASDEYVIANAQLGHGAATAMARIVEDIVPTINRALGYEGPSPIDVEYGGLSTSPLLSGIYVGEKGERAKIYSNIVEAVAAGKNYGDAIELSLDTLVHELTHDRLVAHDGDFHNFTNYVKTAAAIDAKMDQYRGWLKEAMPEAAYNRIRTELVPEFWEMRSAYGSRLAQGVEGVPAGDAAGSTPAGADRRSGSQAGAAADLGAGVQPRGAVSGGDRLAAGAVRAATAAGDAAAEGRPEGEPAGSGSRGSSGEADSAQREYDALVERVAKAFPRGELDFAQAKQLMHELAAENRKMQRRPRETLQAAWDMAGRVMQFHTPQQIKELANALPAPRHADQVEGAINMLHYVDLPDSFKARVKLWYDLSPMDWDRNTVEKWADVEREVQEFIGLDTPENWAQAFARRKGGLTSAEVLLLRQVHNELATKVIEAEGRFAEAVAFGDGALVEAKEQQLTRANEHYMIGAHTLANHLTSQARGLAIARHKVRNLSPLLRFQQDMLAAIRERVNVRFKDPAKAQQMAQQLMGELLKVLRDPNPGPKQWGEWWKFWRAAMQPGMSEKALEWYKAGLLGWPSRVANLVSNTLFRGVRYVEDAAAAALDASKSKLTGSERNVYVGELAVSGLAMRRAVAEAGSGWIKAFQRNIMLQPDDAKALFQKGALAEDLLHGGGAIGGKFGEFVRFQLKGLGHDDELFKNIARTDYLYREIYRRFRKGTYQRKAGESHGAATERMYGELRVNAENAFAGRKYDSSLLRHWELMAEDANKHAKVETFQEDLGNLGRGAQSFLRENPFFQIFFPFIRTPTNIAKETIKRTPIGYIQLARKWKDLSAAERLTEFAKPTVGTIFGAYVLQEAMQGSLTGAGPLDPDELEALKTTGWQPHSIRVGNQWVSYSRFEPLAAIVGIAADAADGLRDGDFDRWQSGALRVMQATAANITDKTFLAGMDNLLSAASHPEQYGKRFVKNLQGTIIPNSIGYVPVAGLSRALDPNYRQAEPLTMDVFYAKLPWMSATLEPQYGPTGEVRKRPGGRVEQVISPFARSERKEGPGVMGAEEIVRIGAAPRSVKSYWLGPGGVRVNLTREERQKLAKAMEQATTLVGQNLVRDPNYQKLPDTEEDHDFRFGMKTKKDVVSRIFAKYRERVMNELRPGLMTRARKAVNERQMEAE